ncbi:MAG: hypothetical protein P4M00_13225 [Azospirillaceae bacterium]|nr:hypothetical protein [Azospirillaceae bacterium]
MISNENAETINIEQELFSFSGPILRFQRLRLTTVAAAGDGKTEYFPSLLDRHRGRVL